MNAAAQLLIGTHDFSTFGVREANDPRPPVKVMRRLEVRRHVRVDDPVSAAARAIHQDGGGKDGMNGEDGDGDESVVTICAECDRFLYNMMRMISGTLVQVGLGRLDAGEVSELLAARRRTEKGEIVKAPPQGLVLQKCFLEDEHGPWSGVDEANGSKPRPAATTSTFFAASPAEPTTAAASYHHQPAASTQAMGATADTSRPCTCRCLACSAAAPHSNTRPRNATCCFVAGRDEPPLPKQHIVSLDESLKAAESALAPQHVTRARRLAATQASMIANTLVEASTRRDALLNRLAAPKEAELGKEAEESGCSFDTCERLIRTRLGLLHCAAALLRVAEERGNRVRELDAAVSALEAASTAIGPKADGEWIPPTAKGGLFERQAYGMWARALQLKGDTAGEQKVYENAVACGVWLHTMQRLLSYYSGN